MPTWSNTGRWLAIVRIAFCKHCFGLVSKQTRECEKTRGESVERTTQNSCKKNKRKYKKFSFVVKTLGLLSFLLTTPQFFLSRWAEFHRWQTDDPLRIATVWDSFFSLFVVSRPFSDTVLERDDSVKSTVCWFHLFVTYFHYFTVKQQTLHRHWETLIVANEIDIYFVFLWQMFLCWAQLAFWHVAEQ